MRKIISFLSFYDIVLANFPSEYEETPIWIMMRWQFFLNWNIFSEFFASTYFIEPKDHNEISWTAKISVFRKIVCTFGQYFLMDWVWINFFWIKMILRTLNMIYFQEFYNLNHFIGLCTLHWIYLNCKKLENKKNSTWFWFTNIFIRVE